MFKSIVRSLWCMLLDHPHEIDVVYGHRTYPNPFIPRFETCSNCDQTRQGYVGEPLLFRKDRHDGENSLLDKAKSKRAHGTDR